MKECKYFGFPFHSNDDDCGQNEDGNGTDDAHIIETIVDDLDIHRFK